MKTLEQLKAEYIEIADECKWLHLRLKCYMDEWLALQAARDAVLQHPCFDGRLPETFWTGNDVIDPDPETM